MDDRGQSVTYRDPMYHGTALSKAEGARLNGKQHIRRMRLLMPFLILAAGFQLFLMAQSPIATVISKLAITAAGTLMVWWFVIPPFRHSLWSRRWRSQYKEMGRCPACQYSLEAISPTLDGCTICPECGGAWRMPA